MFVPTTQAALDHPYNHSCLSAHSHRMHWLIEHKILMMEYVTTLIHFAYTYIMCKYTIYFSFYIV